MTCYDELLHFTSISFRAGDWEISRGLEFAGICTCTYSKLLPWARGKTGAGFPWPNPGCPVALVECDHGEEVRGNITRKTTTITADALQAGATSYCNLVEAGLAVR